MNEIIDLIIHDALWVVLIAGWIFLIVTGLETDKPLSGGLPGNTSAGEELQVSEGFLGRLGELSAWLVFGSAVLALPLILWWIFVVHGRV